MGRHAARQREILSISRYWVDFFFQPCFFYLSDVSWRPFQAANMMLSSTPHLGRDIKVPSVHIDCSEMSHKVILCIREANNLCCRVPPKLLLVWGKHLGPCFNPICLIHSKACKSHQSKANSTNGYWRLYSLTSEIFWHFFLVTVFLFLI